MKNQKNFIQLKFEFRIHEYESVALGMSSKCVNICINIGR